MSTAPLQQAIASTRSVLANVDRSRLNDPTPCVSWDVAALVNHIVGGQRFFAAGVTGEPPASEEDFSAGDFLAAYDVATAACVEAFGADGVMDKTFTLPFGELPGGAFMGLATVDTFQHGWDLAKATGQSTDLDPDLAAGLLAQSQASISDDYRGPEGAPFGPQHDAPDGATTADQLAAFLGREV